MAGGRTVALYQGRNWRGARARFGLTSYDYLVPRLFHVTSSRNRDSIERHGLDWTRMGRIRGVAGSTKPEVDGVFLCRDEFEVDFFCRMDANGGPVDVWAIDGISDDDLVESPHGFAYLPAPIPPERLTLWQSMRLPNPHRTDDTTGAAYESTLTITLSDGRVLSDAAAQEWIQRQLPTDA